LPGGESNIREVFGEGKEISGDEEKALLERALKRFNGDCEGLLGFDFKRYLSHDPKSALQFLLYNMATTTAARKRDFDTFSTFDSQKSNRTKCLARLVTSKVAA
jgi:hypothetical protein